VPLKISRSQGLSILLFPTAAPPRSLFLKSLSWDFGYCQYIALDLEPGIDSETRKCRLFAEAGLGKGVMLGEIDIIFPHLFLVTY
jgi:hypothetical protein